MWWYLRWNCYNLISIRQNYDYHKMMITLRMSEDNARCLSHNTFFSNLVTSINLFLSRLNEIQKILNYQPLNHFKVMFSLNINKMLVQSSKRQSLKGWITRLYSRHGSGGLNLLVKKCSTPMFLSFYCTRCIEYNFIVKYISRMLK